MVKKMKILIKEVRLNLLNYCKKASKVLWGTNTNFPKEARIVDLTKEYKAIVMKNLAIIYNATKRKID